MVTRSRAGFTINIIDTPGLVEGGYVNYQALELIKGLVLGFCDLISSYLFSMRYHCLQLAYYLLLIIIDGSYNADFS